MYEYDRVEQIYQDFWKDIICDEHGNIDLEQVKKELCDFYKMLQEVPKVYSEVTGGLLSKPLYDASTVIQVFSERFGNKAAWVDCLEYDWDNITADCKTNEDYKSVIFKYFNMRNNR